jgi:hypothetical protein
MNIAVVGSRTFTDYQLLATTLKEYDIKQLISGGAIGADRLAEQYAKEHKIPIVVYKPEWNKYDKIAGLLRNTDIIKDADIVIAFWNGISTGTKDSINKAKEMNKQLRIVKI